jgi:serine/threonine-protein kinase HSL1, negative regulator of Swe1 kinase
LLQNYRDRQLENYNPSLTHSSSDYHLLQPANLTTRVSTRQFSQPKPHGHGRSVSKFTVISNVAESELRSEVGTVRSYDPYKSSIILKPSQASHAKITVHRGSPDNDTVRSSITGSQSLRQGVGSVASRRMLYQQRGGSTGRLHSPRSSMSSLRSNRQGTPIVRVNSRYRRGVDFSSIRNPSSDGWRRRIEQGRKGPASIAGDEISRAHRSLSQRSVAPKASKPSNVAEEKMAAAECLVLWDKELQQFSSIIAQDCDDAFKGSLLSVCPTDGADESLVSALALTLGSPDSHSTPKAEGSNNNHRPWDSRPLPPPPRDANGDTMNEKPEAVQNAHGAHIESFWKAKEKIATEQMKWTSGQSSERRTVSEPVHSQYGKGTAPLPSIHEISVDNWTRSNGDKSRAFSAPNKSLVRFPMPHENQGLIFLTQAENTIRVVKSPTTRKWDASLHSVKPLNLSKKLPTGCKPPQLIKAERQQLSLLEKKTHTKEDQKRVSQASSASSNEQKKKRTWFRRSSKSDTHSGEQDGNPPPTSRPSIYNPFRADRSSASMSNGAPPSPPAKKKNFLFNFWKSSKSDPKLSLAGPEYKDSEDDPPSVAAPPIVTSKKRRSRGGLLEEDDGQSQKSGWRKIEPQQNWLARLFRVKPATRYLCLHTSKRRARQEVAILLREWRKYGIRDVEVDKERNVVFARVGASNCKPRT